MQFRFTFFFLFTGLTTFSQFNFDPDKIIEKMTKPIDSDRPGQALSPTTCGIAAIQLQTGFSYTRFVAGIDYNSKNYYIPTNLRFGFTRKWELNTSFFYNKNVASTLIGPVESSGFLSPEIGIRYAFMRGDGWKPFMALQSNVSILSHRGDYQQQQWGSSFYLATSNRFDAMSINTNLGVRFNGTGNFDPVIPYVFNLGFNLGSKVSVFVEGFGNLYNGTSFTPTLNGDAGISYNPIKYLQLDLFGGWLGGPGPHNHWFIEGGVSYKFSFLKYFAKKKINEMKEKYGGGGFGGFNFGG